MWKAFLHVLRGNDLIIYEVNKINWRAGKHMLMPWWSKKMKCVSLFLPPFYGLHIVWHESYNLCSEFKKYTFCSGIQNEVFITLPQSFGCAFLLYTVCYTHTQKKIIQKQIQVETNTHEHKHLHKYMHIYFICH